jgi:hypothetical protein
VGANTSVAVRNALCSTYATNTPFVALYSTAPTTTAGTELTGGAPAYARVASSWSAPASGSMTQTVTHNVASGATVAGVGFHSAATGGTYADGASLTSQPFSSQGTYQTTITYSQT